MEELSNKLEPSIKELKTIFEKINEIKDNLKKDIQNIFTKIRTELNNREDKLFEEIDTNLMNYFLKKNLLKKAKSCLI